MKRMLLAVACAFAASTAAAQGFPSKAMTIVVPNPPGGMNQIHAQPLSAIIERLTKQPAPVVNRSGGTAAVGTAYVANQPADGHTLLVTTPNQSRLVVALEALRGRALEERFDPRADHLRFFTARTLGSLLRGAGFADVSVQAWDGPPGFRRRLRAVAR